MYFQKYTKILRICIVSGCLASIFFLQGCLGARHLKEGEYLLYKQKIKGAKAIDKNELEGLYIQKSNRTFPLIPFAHYVWIYQMGLNNYDSAKYNQKKIKKIEKIDRKIAKVTDNVIKRKRLAARKYAVEEKFDKKINQGNLFMRWGEPLAIFDSAAAKENQLRMLDYIHTKGYFDREVSYEVCQRKNKILVTYFIEENWPYKLDSINYAIEDSTIAQLINKNFKAKKLKKGDVYDQENFEKERNRITDLLLNNGYYKFSNSFIFVELDTTMNHYKVNVIFHIANPPDAVKHKQYVIDSVNFITDANLSKIKEKRQSTYYRGVKYQYYDDRYSKKILNRRHFLYPGDLYSKKNTLSTQQQLSNLDIFRTVNVSYTLSGDKFIANIYTSPAKKYAMVNEVGLNVSQGIPGPLYNFSLKRRNLFKGLEILALNARINYEGVVIINEKGDRVPKFNREIGGDLSIIFPQFIIPISDYRMSRWGNINPKTRIQARYSHTKRPEYTRGNGNASLTYTWQRNDQRFYNFNLTDLSLINSTITDSAFNARLDELKLNGNNLKNSFDPSLVSSMSFSPTFNFNSYGINKDKGSFLRLFLESGGTSLNLFKLDSLILNRFEYYKFLKINADFRHYISVGGTNTFTYRVNLGLAYPYSQNKILPYEKYFFAGGSNGIRAWRPRRLGPGSYSLAIDTLDFEQPGEILMEASIEFRRNLVGFIDWAFFVDVGNVWTINDDGRPGAKFEFKDFYREIAVGTGLGIRLDFQFLIFRFDYAIKVYDPTRSDGDRFVLGKLAHIPEPAIINFGIGYPF